MGVDFHHTSRWSLVASRAPVSSEHSAAVTRGTPPATIAGDQAGSRLRHGGVGRADGRPGAGGRAVGLLLRAGRRPIPQLFPCRPPACPVPPPPRKPMGSVLHTSVAVTMAVKPSSFASQIHKEEHEWVAGTAARSFAPWVGRVREALQPQPSGSRTAGSTDISVRVSIPQTCRRTQMSMAGSGRSHNIGSRHHCDSCCCGIWSGTVIQRDVASP